MKIRTITLIAPLLLSLVTQARCESAASSAQTTAGFAIFDAAAKDADKRLQPAEGMQDQISVARSADASTPGVEVTIQPGKAGYPGVTLKPDGAETWDLSKYGHVEARIKNTGTKTLSLSLRVDNAGDWHESPWNTESASIKPGATGTVKVIFGFSYGLKPGYALKSNAVANLLLFCKKSEAAQSFVVESIAAAGQAGEKPPLDASTVRVKAKNGLIFGTGAESDVFIEGGRTIKPWNVARAGTPLPDVSMQVEGKGGAEGTVNGKELKLHFPAGGGDQSVVLKPATGRWDLRDVAEIRVKIKNTGSSPITPSLQLGSATGSTDKITAPQPIAPGAEQEIAVPFAASVPGVAETVTKAGYYSLVNGTGTKFGSDAAGPLKISVQHQGDALFTVESITGDTPVAQVPDWLGKRPPVDGDWVKTFDDEFDGSSIDQKKWNIYGQNYWDKVTHWTKDNLILGGGKVTMRFEKKRGYQNDDPKQMLALSNPKSSESDYACGFLETYGKWVQRYGYFEARVKLPVAWGLWPTFWLMPDRGAEAGPQWKRQATNDGAMEMDIMEHLTRWGPHRYNIANHWDGYGKEHKSNGSTFNYVLPDKDGFITCGLLWTPGSVTYYANGKEMVKYENPRISNVPSNIIIEMTTGGWDNNSVDDSQLPVDYVIDYVRVWQRKDLASPADGYKSAATPGEAAAK